MYIRWTIKSLKKKLDNEDVQLLLHNNKKIDKRETQN